MRNFARIAEKLLMAYLDGECLWPWRECNPAPRDFCLLHAIGNKFGNADPIQVANKTVVREVAFEKAVGFALGWYCDPAQFRAITINKIVLTEMAGEFAARRGVFADLTTM